MKVRDATEDDFDELLRMGEAFTKAAGKPDVDDDSLLMTLDHLMENGILKVVENGALCGVAGALVFPHFWNRDKMVAQELFWWVDENARGTSAALRLLVALENEAKARGADNLMMLCLDDLNGDKVAEMYTRLGYEPIERSFVKTLGDL